MIKFLISASVLTLASTAVTYAAAPDLAKGSAIATQVCAACHGAEGNATGAANPKLAGQHPEYLAKQLHNFKAGKDGKAPERNNAVMGGFASALSDDDIRNVSAFYAAQTIKPASGKNAALKKQGEKIWRGGIADKGIAACASCHGANGKGIPVQYPRLGGQWGEYTESQLTAFRQGTRKNSAQMSTIAAKMSDAEIKAVSDYAASLR
jgi:cbb3-type cytochrome c oxidase subunit III